MSHKRKAKLGITFGIFLLLVIVILYFFFRLSAPHQGAIQQGTPTTRAASFDMTPTPINGKYESFSYPSGMEIKRNNPIVYPVKEQFNFLHRDIESWNLAVAVMDNPGGSVSSNNAYQERRIKPNRYKESNETVNGMPVVVMTESGVGGFSKVAFLQVGSLGATISLYGDDTSGTKYLQQTFDLVLHSWQWH